MLTDMTVVVETLIVRHLERGTKIRSGHVPMPELSRRARMDKPGLLIVCLWSN